METMLQIAKTTQQNSLKTFPKQLFLSGLFAERRRCFAVTCKTSWFPSALCCERASKHALVAGNRGDPASKYRGAILVLFGVKTHNGFATVREMKYTSHHCCDKTMDNKMTLYRKCCFSNCKKSWWIKWLLTVLGWEGDRIRPWPGRRDICCFVTCRSCLLRKLNIVERCGFNFVLLCNWRLWDGSAYAFLWSVTSREPPPAHCCDNASRKYSTCAHSRILSPTCLLRHLVRNVVA